MMVMIDGVKGLMEKWLKEKVMITKTPILWMLCPALPANAMIVMMIVRLMIIMITRWVVDDYHDDQVGSQPASDGSLSSSSWSPRWPLQQGNITKHHDDDSNKVTLQGIMMMAYRPSNIIVIIIIKLQLYWIASKYLDQVSAPNSINGRSATVRSSNSSLVFEDSPTGD